MVEIAESKEFRVTFDGGMRYYRSEESADEKAKSLARIGVPCELETRRSPGQLWRLKYSYIPGKEGRFQKVDPYKSGTGIAFEDESLQGRIAT